MAVAAKKPCYQGNMPAGACSEFAALQICIYELCESWSVLTFGVVLLCRLCTKLLTQLEHFLLTLTSVEDDH